MKWCFILTLHNQRACCPRAGDCLYIQNGRNKNLYHQTGWDHLLNFLRRGCAPHPEDCDAHGVSNVNHFLQVIRSSVPAMKTQRGTIRTHTGSAEHSSWKLHQSQQFFITYSTDLHRFFFFFSLLSSSYCLQTNIWNHFSL